MSNVVEQFYLSSAAMTVGVTVENGKITYGPPIVRKFLGQPIGNLIRWMAYHEGDLHVVQQK